MFKFPGYEEIFFKKSECTERNLKNPMLLGRDFGEKKMRKNSKLFTYLALQLLENQGKKLKLFQVPSFAVLKNQGKKFQKKFFF